MSEQKLKVKDNVRQLLPGMDKASGHIAFKHLSKNIPVAEKSFEFIQVYGLLCDFETRRCKVYELVMNFSKGESNLMRGEEELDISTAMSRLSTTLKQ